MEEIKTILLFILAYFAGSTYFKFNNKKNLWTFLKGINTKFKGLEHKTKKIFLFEIFRYQQSRIKNDRVQKNFNMSTLFLVAEMETDFYFIFSSLLSQNEVH